MSSWTSYWRIVSPPSRKSTYTQPQVAATIGDNYNTSAAGYGTISQLSWTNQFNGSTSRFQRYKQFDSMDIGDINRALDIIAEEMASKDERTNLVFEIDYQIEDNQEVEESTVTTIRAALRHWAGLHDLETKIFKIARLMVKYGDCIFKKTSDTKVWEYIDHTRVAYMEVDQDLNPVNYYIRPSNMMANMPGNQHKNEHLELVPARAVIRFTHADDLSSNASFGYSVLQSAVQDYQKLTMLENASIIFRLSRAPNRRVWKIDVGNMPPNRVKQYLNEIKDDARQRRAPNSTNFNQADGYYNADSMLEDIYLAVPASGRQTSVENLEGQTTWEVPELDFYQNRILRSLRVPSSYMKGQDAAAPGANYNDGKVGVAYMEERIFANFVKRLQAEVDTVFDAEFKIYLKTVGINIDTNLFKLRLPEPQNFAKYRQTALDAELITSFNNLADVKYLSKRFMLERFLGLTKDEVQMNESMLKQEMGIEGKKFNVSELQIMYDPDVKEAAVKPDEIEPGDELGSEPGGEESAPGSEEQAQ